MRALLRRIAVNGLLTAVVLAAMGFVYAELAAMFLAGNAVPRAEPVEHASRAAENEALSQSLRLRVPLTMAAFGFLFVALGELVLYAWRGNPPLVEVKTAAEKRADPAEKLLEELLAQADAAMAATDAPPLTTHPERSVSAS